MRLGLRSLQVLQRPRLGIEERWIQVSFFDARRFRGQSRGLTRRPGYAQGSRHVEAQLGLSLLARADDERAGGSERGSAIPRNAIPCDERRDVHAVLRMRQRELARPLAEDHRIQYGIACLPIGEFDTVSLVCRQASALTVITVAIPVGSKFLRRI
jgi:hypothetical protein